MSLYTIRKTTDGIVVHCSATKPSQDIGVKDISQWHRAKGWIGCGYHFVIRRDGTIEEGRPVNAVGAHVEGHNSTTIGICLAGGVRESWQKGMPGDGAEDNFTPSQKAALAKLIHQLRATYTNTTVKGHRDYPGVRKSCPCFNVIPWWNMVKGSGHHLEVPQAVEGATIEVTKDYPTYWSLARHHNMDVRALVGANPEHPPHTLKVGTVLRRPD